MLMAFLKAVIIGDPYLRYLALGAGLFCIGLYGTLTRRNAIGILMSIEIMFNGVNLNLVAVSSFLTPAALTGQVFAILVMALAAAEVSIGLALVYAVYRNMATSNIDQMNLMKW